MPVTLEPSALPRNATWHTVISRLGNGWYRQEAEGESAGHTVADSRPSVFQLREITILSVKACSRSGYDGGRLKRLAVVAARRGLRLYAADRMHEHRLAGLSTALGSEREP